MRLSECITGIQHIGIPTHDIAATIAFYESLGFPVVFRSDSCGESTAFMAYQNLMIETYESRQTTGKPGAIDHIAIDVNDIQKAYDAVALLGYPSLEGAVQSLPFWENGIRYFTISGPNGEKVEFSQKL